MRSHHDARAIERASGRTVEETLAAQRRTITRPQALAAGLTTAQIDQRLRSHRWRRVHTGVYTDADPTADDVRVWAAWLWGGSGAVLGGQAALYWAGLAATVPDVIDLYLPASRSRQRKRDIRFRRSYVPTRDTVWHYGLRMTSTSRSAIDLARWEAPDSFLEVVMRRVEHGLEALEDALRRCRALSGYPAALAAVRDVQTNPWSVPESRLHRSLEAHGISGWTANQRLVVLDAAVRPDVAFPGIKLAVEVDGRRYHAEAADSAAFEHDAWRRKMLTDAGWFVLHFTAQQILTDADGVVKTIMSVIARLTALRAA